MSRKTNREIGPLYHFPILHRDDCFYDILARFHEHSGHLNYHATSIELFDGILDLRVAISLPCRANLIYQWLGQDSNISMETLRDYHSAWQYLQLCSHISEAELIPIIRADTRPGRRKQAKMISMLRDGLTAMRYCPICLVEDKTKEREAYWHQSHQLYGVKYCPLHGVPLMNSSVSTEKRLTRYTTASSVLRLSSDAELLGFGISARKDAMNNDPFYDEYVALARTIAWLLQNALSLGSHEQVNQLYAKKIGGTAMKPSGTELYDLLAKAWSEDFLLELFPDGHFIDELKTSGVNGLNPLGHALIVNALALDDRI